MFSLDQEDELLLGSSSFVSVFFHVRATDNGQGDKVNGSIDYSEWVVVRF